MTSTLKHILVYTLISILVLPPAAVAQGGITPDAAAQAGKRPGMDSAANGVPVVNITAPNTSGLSHNQYSDFNVRQQGAILNNSAQDSLSQLGGIVLGNNNLGSSGSAKTILNEVTSANRSYIQGYIEVSGQKADVILANPNGITINGGGFINTDRATMTTGKPEFDAAGLLRSFEVRQGDVRIEGDGINAGNITGFDIISRAAEINANIHANELNIVAGQNSYDPKTGVATPLADDGSPKPMLAIDSSALGGMYAGRIKLTSNETGVGVNLQGLVQSVNDMEITADGRLALRAAKSGASMTLASNNEIAIAEAAIADKNLEARAKNITLDNVTVGAQEKLDIRVQEKFSVTGGSEATGIKQVFVQASAVSLADATLNGGSLNLRADKITVGVGGSLEGDSLDLQAGITITVENGGAVLALDSAALQSENLANRGLIYAADKLDFKINDTLSNLGGADILAGGDIYFGGLASGSRMGTLHNQASTIESLNGNISVYAANMFNDGGTPTTRRVSDGYDYKIIGWVGDRASLPHDDNNGFQVTAELYADPTIPYYAYGPGGQKNYLTDREYLIKSSSVVAAYVQQMYGLYGIPNQLAGKYEGLQEWKEYSYDVLLTPATPSMFMAAGNINLDVSEITNAYSTISAGGNIDITADKLTNRGLEISRYTNIERAFLSTGSSGTRKIESIDKIYYEYAELLESVPASISAGGSVNINATEQLDNSVIKAGAYYAGVSSGIPGFNGFPQGGSWQNGGQWLPEIKLGGLFNASTDPDHKYLIETNPKLVNFGNFYGSEYFLNKIGYDLTLEQSRLLGDAYFETRYVREQILAQSGQRYLFDGVSDDAATMLMLMNNAAAMQSGLGLSVGVSLTPEQISSLTKDIIWLEEIEYDGQTVLVPRLYLCDATKAELAVRGSNISGADVNMASAYINNQGGISGQNVTLTASNDLLNKGGSIFGSNSLVINADGSIINQSGTLGGGDITLAAGQDVRFETLVRQESAGIYGNTAHVSQMAQVSAVGNLTVQAGNNIEMIGADVKAAGAASLNADGNVLIGSQAMTTAGGHTNSNYSYTAQLGSSVEAGELSVNARENIMVIGSTVRAEGDAALNAGGSIMAAAAQEESHTYFYAQKSGGTFGSSSKQKISTDSTTAVGSLISGGGNLTVNAGDALVVSGSGFAAGNDLSVSANSMVFDVAENYSRTAEQSSSSGLLNGKNKVEINESLINTGSFLAAGNNVSIKTEGDATFRGTTIEAGQDALFNIGGSLNLLAAHDSVSNYSKTSKSSWGGLKKTIDIKFNENTMLAGSVVNTLDGLNIITGRDVNVIGSDINAGGDANILAGYRLTETGLEKSGLGGSVNVINDFEEVKAYSFHKEIDYTKGVKDILTGDISNFELSFSNGKFQVSQELGSSEATTNDINQKNVVGSNINVGGNLTIGADGDINVAASNIMAGGDAVFDAKNINLLSEYNVEDTKFIHELTTISSTATVGNAYVDAALAVKALIDATKEVKDAKDELSKMKDLRDQGRASDSAVKDAELNLAMSVANEANALIALGMAVAGAASAASSGMGTGIYASAGLSYESTKTTTTTQSNTSVGSNVVAAGDIIFNASGDMAQIGSNVLSEEANVYYKIGQDLLIAAADNTYSSRSKTESENASISVGNNGVASGSFGASSGKSSSMEVVWTNSTTTAENGSIVFDVGSDMKAEGYNALAEHIIADVGGDLTLASKQNSAQSSGSSSSMNIGGSSSGSVSGGFSTGKDSGNRNWADDKSSLIGTESVDINVEGTLHLAGSQIANVQDGIDQGNLNISAGDLTWTDLQNSQESKSSGFGVNTSVSLGGNTASTKNNSSGQYAAGSTTVSAERSGQETEGLTLATIGQGNITLGSERDLSGLNRDIDNMDIITKDMITGALDFEVTVDHRLLTEAGRAEIKEEMKKLPGNLVDASIGAVQGTANLGKATLDTVATIGDALVGDGNIGDLFGDVNDQISKMQADHEFRKQKPEAAAVLANPGAYSAEEVAAAEQLQATFDKKYGVIRDETGTMIYAFDNKFVSDKSGEEERRNAGYDQEENRILLNLFGNDGNIVSGEELAGLRGHEASESKYEDHERAERFGDYAASNYSWANWLNGISGDTVTVSNEDWFNANSGSTLLNFNNWIAKDTDPNKTHNTSVSVETELIFRPEMGEKTFLSGSAQLWTATGAGALKTLTLGGIDIDTSGVGVYYDELGGIETSGDRANEFEDLNFFGDKAGKVLGAVSWLALLKSVMIL